MALTAITNLCSLHPLATAAGVVLTDRYLDAKYGMALDFRIARTYIKFTISEKIRARRDKVSAYYPFENTCKSHAHDLAYICEGKQYTWSMIYSMANRLGHYFLKKGVQKGEVVAVDMSNKPAFVVIWIGLLSIGAIPAFINYNLSGQAFEHCVLVAEARYLLYDADLSGVVHASQERLELVTKERGQQLGFIEWHDEFTVNGGLNSELTEKGSQSSNATASLPHAEIIDASVLMSQSDERIPDSRRADLVWTSPACLIYTSGTTGLPKAAVVSHGKMASSAWMWTGINKFKRSDRIYTAMPMYHSSAALLAINVSWYAGSTVIIGRKFSVRTFWEEVRAYDATVIQYIGEICRYLLAGPPSAKDKAHKVRLAYGNGMRPDVWNRFRDRFAVPAISEFFAATEGNMSLWNYNVGEFGSGAVGKEGPIIRTFAAHAAIIRIDPILEEPERTPAGFCVRAAPREAGELLLKIDMDRPGTAFVGYHKNPEASQKKIMRNVFVKDDAYFRTGDLLSKDENNFYFFGDRLGDTFRFRSENVSTAEVSAAMGAVVDEANVYGVLVPNTDGRAGCAAIPETASVDLKRLAEHLPKVLPKYAIPQFIRIVKSMDTTGTAKQLKVALRNEGVDPHVVKDPLFWLRAGQYIPFTHQDWTNLQGGSAKL